MQGLLGVGAVAHDGQPVKCWAQHQPCMMRLLKPVPLAGCQEERSERRAAERDRLELLLKLAKARFRHEQVGVRLPHQKY